MMQGELRIELRGGEAPPGMLVVLPPGVPPPTSLPPGATVVAVSADGPEVLHPDGAAEVVGTARWTAAGGWRVRSHVTDDASSVVDLSSWGSPELRVLRTRDGAAGPTVRLPREEEGEVVVGRSPDCDLSLDDNSVSRRHARIVRRDRRFYLEDMFSKGGTFLGEERIGEARLLRHQDRIRIGQTVLEFFSLLDALVEESAAGEAAAAAPARRPSAAVAAAGREPAAAAPKDSTEPASDAASKLAAPATSEPARGAGRPTWETGVLGLIVVAVIAAVGYVLTLLFG